MFFLLCNSVVGASVDQDVRAMYSQVQALRIRFRALRPFNVSFPVVPYHSEVGLLLTIAVVNWGAFMDTSRATVHVVAFRVRLRVPFRLFREDHCPHEARLVAVDGSAVDM